MLEDDARCVPDFGTEVRKFWRRLPTNWSWLYLGGQHIEMHLGMPKEVNELVYVPFNVNRLHAYAVRGSEIIRGILDFIASPEIWDSKHHIDHRLGELHKLIQVAEEKNSNLPIAAVQTSEHYSHFDENGCSERDLGSRSADGLDRRQTETYRPPPLAALDTPRIPRETPRARENSQLPHAVKQSGLYVPANWLFAQSEGESDIAGSRFGRREFRNTKSLCEASVTTPMVAVLGPFSGGTSAVSGLLHKLGVSMGSVFSRGDKTNEKGHYEALELGRFCRQMFEEPSMTVKLGLQARIRLLRIWASGHCEMKGDGRGCLGGKHPSFCLMGPELEAAWNRPKFISVDRPIDEVSNSLARRGWGWPLDSCINTTQLLIDAKRQFTTTTESPVLHISYNRFVENPRMSAEAICDFLGISPTASQLEDAVAFVRKPKSIA